MSQPEQSPFSNDELVGLLGSEQFQAAAGEAAAQGCDSAFVASFSVLRIDEATVITGVTLAKRTTETGRCSAPSRAVTDNPDLVMLVHSHPRKPLASAYGYQWDPTLYDLQHHAEYNTGTRPRRVITGIVALLGGEYVPNSSYFSMTAGGHASAPASLNRHPHPARSPGAYLAQEQGHTAMLEMMAQAGMRHVDFVLPTPPPGVIVLGGLLTNAEAARIRAFTAP